MNVDTSGLSINAIRYFPGNGILVWGARTLDGNSLDFRYVPVTRFCMMVEQSLVKGLKVYASEPNNAITWSKVKATVETFLTHLWKQGALAGAKPEDGFSVHIGLGQTMTAEDIEDGRMLLTILLAVSRPAEFIELSISFQMKNV